MKMKHLLISILLAFTMSACSGTASQNEETTGDTYNVSVDNEGDGDIIIITDGGTIVTNEKDECIVITETSIPSEVEGEEPKVEKSERNCSEDELLIKENAMYQYYAAQ